MTNQLERFRTGAGLSVLELARLAGISRQTVYAIERGTYVPNTTLSLRLAKLLGTSVEALFQLENEEESGRLPRSVKATWLEGDGGFAHAPVELCRVGKRMMASHALSGRIWSFPEADGIAVAMDRKSDELAVGLYSQRLDFENRLLLAGCDPAASILRRELEPSDVRLVLAHRNSSQALDLLRRGLVHIAGTHLRDEASGESNLPAVEKLFGRKSVAVVAFATWEEGLLTVPGNPKDVKSVQDLARPELSFINREAGSGSRRVLDWQLKKVRLSTDSVCGYDNVATGQLAAARAVFLGEADCCIATSAAARLFGLNFTPLCNERYDLVLRRSDLNKPPFHALLGMLKKQSFRKKLEMTSGYDMQKAGERVL